MVDKNTNCGAFFVGNVFEQKKNWRILCCKYSPSSLFSVVFLSFLGLFFASRFSYCLRRKFVWVLRHGMDAVYDPAKKKKQSGSVFTRSLFINRPCKIVLLHLKRPWRYYCSNLFIKVKAWNVITFFVVFFLLGRLHQGYLTSTLLRAHKPLMRWRIIRGCSSYVAAL